jgi:hypothetical protein
VLDEAALSPDGRWIAAVAAEAGRTLLYNIPVEGGNPVLLVESTDGVIARPL